MIWWEWVKHVENADYTVTKKADQTNETNKQIFSIE